MTTNIHTDEHSGGYVPPETVKVWDIFVRLFHWSLVASFAIAWLSADEWGKIHDWTGYIAAGLVGARIVWGLVGTRYARFSNFLGSPASIVNYLGRIIRGTEERYVGHNPAGGAMIVVLLLGVLGLGVTGWMMTDNAFWGVAWVADLHEMLANAMLVLVALHIAGVVLASWRHGENLIGSMITGRKRASQSGLSR